MGLSFLRFGFLVLVVSGVSLFVPVHVVKREGRPKPTTTARDFLRSRQAVKNPSTVLEFTSFEQPV
jgi:hypothetical protein